MKGMRKGGVRNCERSSCFGLSGFRANKPVNAADGDKHGGNDPPAEDVIERVHILGRRGRRPS